MPRKNPVTIQHDLVRELWTTVKDMRDELLAAEHRRQQLDDLLQRMKAAGLSEWLPTLEEAQAAWNNT